ncbi:MAG TPA: cob(I)yrinic acid a,c-diamide adenosyltransferase [Kiritimatiellia bacterium]|nr:cob(I)yrinic acid a,c-diamide adenosyltransferase [Kiritimatiellia bacterium]HMO98518.1 cob(I)yrinic acid a,c-diamide adenosyltransferase [Kiritimatiellia bacterium]HMP95826.1 cob(I)yrinic acid a,c-diamide adenosyltransferase [Kiritimatiellia bacterium]
MSITTKVGDHGTTFLFSGEEVAKDCPRTEAYGDIDELVSILGIARAQSEKPEVRETVFWIQVELFVVATELATETSSLALVRERMDARRVASLDERRERLERQITMPRGFIIPGGTLAAAVIDHARTVARRCERKAVGLARSGMIDNPDLLIWLNRLSDFLWLLARFEEGEATVLKP